MAVWQAERHRVSKNDEVGDRRYFTHTSRSVRHLPSTGTAQGMTTDDPAGGARDEGARRVEQVGRRLTSLELPTSLSPTPPNQAHTARDSRRGADVTANHDMQTRPRYMGFSDGELAVLDGYLTYPTFNHICDGGPIACILHRCRPVEAGPADVHTYDHLAPS